MRLFIDEGLPMVKLLSEAKAQGIMPDYVGKLLAGFEAEEKKNAVKSPSPSALSLIDPLSQRELEVLQLIAQGLSNHEIGERLFLALVFGRQTKILLRALPFGKLFQILNAFFFEKCLNSSFALFSNSF